MAAELCAIGMPFADTLIGVDRIPGPNQDVPMRSFSFQGGGKVTTASVTAAELGITCCVMGIVGDDAYGRFLLEDFDYYGIDRAGVLSEGDTAFSVILSDAETRGRTIVLSERKGRWLTPGEIDREKLAACRILHLDRPFEAHIEAAKCVRDAGGLVSFDGDQYEDGTQAMMPLIDIFIGSEFYYQRLFGSSPDYRGNMERVRALGPRVVVFTLGERGCVGVSCDGYFEEPAFRVDVADTLGAGDVYHGAWLAGYLRGLSARESARLANAVAAIKCTRRGGRAGIPDWDTAQEFMRSGHIDYTRIDQKVKKYEQRK